MDVACLQLLQNFWAYTWHCPQVQFGGRFSDHFVKGEAGPFNECRVGIHDMPVGKACDNHGIRALSEDRGEFSLGQARRFPVIGIDYYFTHMRLTSVFDYR
ncbi:MAG: hypothetical protein BEH78_10480 [Pseudomonas sp. BDAL1]|nr:MAG: hypothetical protein BEH78_10480 [Pseudomonas sp. BDAL1]